jgi:hypothetical protein
MRQPEECKDNKTLILFFRLNLVQASWGVGRAYFSSSAQPITLTPHNPLCRFKAVGYSVLPKASKVLKYTNYLSFLKVL